MAQHWCRQNGLDFKLLLPLIKETSDRVEEELRKNEHFDLKKLQTGPAIRSDKATIEKHLGLLKESEQLSELYKMFTKQIQNK